MTFLSPQVSFSDVRSAADTTPRPQTDAKKNSESLRKLYSEITSIQDKEGIQKYIKKRLNIVETAKITPEEVVSPQTVSVVDVENLNKKQQKTISAYEKIYQDSLNRAQTMDTPLNAEATLDGHFYQYVNEEPKPFVPDFPYVTIKLSDKKEIMAPAEEHIAYMLTTILIEANGLMRVTEEFIFVSNNEDFPAGFFRIMPKYTYSRTGEKRRLDLTLKSVTVNGEEYPYKVTEIGNHLHIEPQKPLNLPTGIYTYKFNYLVDRGIWFYDNFDELNWNITGKTLRNVVGSANAVVSLPEGKTFLAQNALTSTRNGINPDRVTITDLETNTLAFADTEALAVGEDIHLFITLDKGTIIAPDLMKKYLWFIQDFGTIIFAMLSLVAIWLSYRISLKQIRRNKEKTKVKLRKSPAIFRLINSNTFDIRSLLSEILDLVAKNIINIKKNNDTAVLLKKTDNLKSLHKATQKFINTLFPTTETILPANDLSLLKLNRAYKFLRRTTYKEYHLYLLKLNMFYLIFSSAMLLCAITASAFVSINTAHTFWIILTCTLLFVPYIILLKLKFKKTWMKWLIKTFSAISLLYIAAWLAIYTSYLYAALIIISIAFIIFYYQEFSKRSGLLRNKIRETEEYKSYLQKNPELAVSARDFNTRIPYIYAFALENKYPTAEELELIKQFEHLLTSQTKKD